MESVSLGDPNGYRQENDSVGGSFFITDGDEFLMDEVNHANTLPTISGIDSSVQKRSIVSERKFKGALQFYLSNHLIQLHACFHFLFVLLATVFAILLYD